MSADRPPSWWRAKTRVVPYIVLYHRGAENAGGRVLLLLLDHGTFIVKVRKESSVEVRGILRELAVDQRLLFKRRLF